MAQDVASELASLPGVAVVTLGGSRATGSDHPTSDWDLGLYHEGPLDPSVPTALAELDPAGTVTEPGDWGRIVDGGGWLLVDGIRIDVLYRDLDVVRQWIAEAEAGRFEIDELPGSLAGLPTYTLVGEAALGQVLAGEADALPRPGYPDALCEAAPDIWRFRRSFSLSHADAHALRHDVVACAGMLARAALEEAHARCAERREWVLNEKGLAARAGLDGAAFVLSNLSMDRSGLAVATAELRALLNPSGEQPPGLPG
jgi:predicted nucleotidyltransferase